MSLKQSFFNRYIEARHLMRGNRQLIILSLSVLVIALFQFINAALVMDHAIRSKQENGTEVRLVLLAGFTKMLISYYGFMSMIDLKHLSIGRYANLQIIYGLTLLIFTLVHGIISGFEFDSSQVLRVFLYIFIELLFIGVTWKASSQLRKASEKSIQNDIELSKNVLKGF